MIAARRIEHTGLVALVALGSACGPAALAQERIGVAVCDKFLDKYESCVKDKTGSQRAHFEDMIGQLRETWKQMASDPQTKPSLEAACKQTIDAVRQSLNAAPFNCGL